MSSNASITYLEGDATAPVGEGRKIILVMGKQTWERHTELVIDSVVKRPVPKGFRRNFPN